MQRRDFIKSNSVLAAGAVMIPQVLNASVFKDGFISKRPPVGKRNFTSKAVEEAIKNVKKAIKNPELGWMFENCFPNTLDTTVNYKEVDGRPDTFVITGDIHAMWLRDSSAQVWPYVPLAKKDKDLQKLLSGVVNRQTDCILIDPYANAFNESATGSEWETDSTDMKPELHERKWEIDSLCYPIRLAYHYWKTTGDTSVFDKKWEKAMKLVLKTFIEQQRKEGDGPYKFMRKTEVNTDTMPMFGAGNPVVPVGLIASGFRPSDDATTFLFLVPSNFFAVTSLKQLNEIFTEVIKDKEFASKCTALANEVSDALKEYAIVEHKGYGNIFPFEVDGFGNKLFMDDANVPSLLAMPYLGTINADDPIYQNTRAFVWGKDNPFFFKGTKAEGIGGPHKGMDLIWPMSITMKALTSDNDEEIKGCIETLMATHGGTGFMHEAFHKDDPSIFHRTWFAWANTLFGELILKVYNERPQLLKEI
ncbi:glycoside hydrolase family 125 protein [Flammeovirgaceae bacterium SG7u.111]|nr:glycoside hydrolase family 125 protein [Flammeovirgaceae bacterium SG7u.132]WPO35725.1 glycoside hydrolase family 125 protein [Flammeovirgaceae bacterium SG7u.111]